MESSSRILEPDIVGEEHYEVALSRAMARLKVTSKYVKK